MEEHVRIQMQVIGSDRYSTRFTLIEKLWYVVRFAHSATSLYEMEDFQSGILV